MLISSAQPSYANVPHSAGTGLRQPFASLFHAARAALARRRTRIALEDLDAHLLSDIGVHRSHATIDPFAAAIDCSSWR